MARSNDGQPQSDLNLASEVKSTFLQAAQTYRPFSKWLLYTPVNGRSVPFSRRIRYCSGVSSFFHCALVFAPGNSTFAADCPGVFLVCPLQDMAKKASMNIKFFIGLQIQVFGR